MAARLVGAAAEQGDASLGGAASYLRDGRLSLGPLEAGEIARYVLLPRDALVEVRAQQLGHRAQLLEPHAHAFLADAARPEPHDQHARAVVRRRGLVDALGDDAGPRRAHRSSWGAPIWPPSLFKRRGLRPPRTSPANARTRPGAAVARLGLDTGCLIAAPLARSGGHARRGGTTAAAASPPSRTRGAATWRDSARRRNECRPAG